ncbi:TPA: hypothetical protein HA219_04325 [Candidatus Woesearchaeota archaeon]|nr:hypothetical protein [uncultured archaeon]AQS32086.1 hypothetical protein [uncultured archaeon]MBS3115280.1 hypothetical protein [Candidatus Woesearchaeota archaeon]HIH39916.1 hypothetical protein [Candidatus Woesearchaeota archaeon]
MEFKQQLKRFWHFIWEDDSLLSWIVNIILAFVLIKFIVFPVLGLILGSQFPLVAVVSSSMDHNAEFDVWWDSSAVCGSFVCKQSDYYKNIGITKEQFQTFKLKNGFNKGDVMVLSSAKNLEVGDVIVFLAKDGRPIIHRVVKLNPVQTKGDGNKAQITPAADPAINEQNIPQEIIIGKASLRIPFLGWVKIIFAYILSLFGIKVA